MKKRIFMIVSFLATVFLLNSCLKDDVGVDWPYTVSGKMYAEIWNAGFQALGLAPVPDTVTFKFLVNIASDQPPTSDITVKLWVDVQALNDYDTLKHLSYKLYPYIQIVDSNLVIKAGTRNAYVHVKVWHADLLDACDNFIAPIAIKSATGGVIPAAPLNQGARLMALPISNPYQGEYHDVGTLDHPSAGHILLDLNKSLYTIDCKTVGTTIGALGAGEVTFTVNADNSVTIGGSYSPTQPCLPIAGDPNVYDPATKTFTVSYEYTGSGGFRVYHEVYTRL